MIRGHEIAVLEFSGGKDSLACLKLLEPNWNDLTVLWMNTGGAFPETIAQMKAIKALVPHFLEVNSDQPTQNLHFGPPSDVMSFWDTVYAKPFFDSQLYRLQTPLQCCCENIWLPMDKAVKEMGATLVIRGQRNSERYKSPARSGYKEGGIEYWFPLEDWTEDKVFEFVEELPEHYNFVNSSLDCMTCTAYLQENRGKFRYLRDRHPEVAAAVRNKLLYIESSLIPSLNSLQSALGELHG